MIVCTVHYSSRIPIAPVTLLRMSTPQVSGQPVPHVCHQLLQAAHLPVDGYSRLLCQRVHKNSAGLEVQRDGGQRGLRATVLRERAGHSKVLCFLLCFFFGVLYFVMYLQTNPTPELNNVNAVVAWTAPKATRSNTRTVCAPSRCVHRTTTCRGFCSTASTRTRSRSARRAICSASCATSGRPLSDRRPAARVAPQWSAGAPERKPSLEARSGRNLFTCFDVCSQIMQLESLECFRVYEYPTVELMKNLLKTDWK